MGRNQAPIFAAYSRLPPSVFLGINPRKTSSPTNGFAMRGKKFTTKSIQHLLKLGRGGGIKNEKPASREKRGLFLDSLGSYGEGHATDPMPKLRSGFHP
jgi:hypothetical protein